MADKRLLTDRLIKTLKPAAPGQRYEIWDSVVPGFGVRVTDNGKRTYILVARFPGSTNPTRRAIGDCGAISLEKARAKAREWLELIGRGVDPAALEEQRRRAYARERTNTFGAVAEKFIEHIKANKERKAGVVERDLRRVFIEPWGDRPIKEITAYDVATIIDATVKRGKRARAHNLFGHVRRLFRWAIPLHLEHSPCANLSPKQLIGERVARDVILTDDGLRVLWRASGRAPYPYGQIYRLLMLSALRLGDVCGAAWPEFNTELVKLVKARKPDDRRPDWSGLSNDWKLWTIPATRMKKTGGEAKPHVVPLTDAMLDVLWEIPYFKGGDFLFSNDSGKSPLKANHFSKPKARIDQRMLRTLRATFRKRGDDQSKATLRRLIETSQDWDNWDTHDIRRTVRTNLSALRVAEEVREAVLAHARPGIKGTYDRWQYLDEKREALTLWAGRLRSIVEPRPANVVPIPTVRAAAHT